MLYSYVGYKPSGEVVKGILEAESEQQAEESLWKSELTILTLAKKRAMPSIREQLPSVYGVQRLDVLNFTRDLHALLIAGIGIHPALTMLYERDAKPSLKKLIGDLLLSVETGNTFSEACALHPKQFSPFYLRMIKVGEEIGNMEQMLEQVTVQMVKEDEIRKKVKGAMIYPAIVILVAIGAIAALVTFVIPAMEGLFDQINRTGELPLLTRMVVALSDFVTGNILFIFLGVVAVFGGSILFFRTERGKETMDTILLKIPVINSVIIKGFMARTARNLAILLGGGVTVTESLDLIIETSDNVHFKEAFIEVRRGVGDGLLLSQAMKNRPIFPSYMYQVIGVGELTGRLEPNLEGAADHYERETDAAVQRSVTMLTPILTLFVGGIVAVIGISIYAPIYSMAGQIQ
jgi:type IV pilus assembly protein PilC